MNALEIAILKMKLSLGLTSQSPIIRKVRPAYDALLRTVYGDRGVARSFHGEAPLFLRLECRAISEEGDKGDGLSCAILKRLARPGGVVLDVGANIGVYSMLFARWGGSAGRVFAFEPAPSTLELLRAHLRLNQLEAQVEVVAQAVSDKVGEAVFYTHSFSGENSLNPVFSARGDIASSVRVPVTTLDQFCQARNLAPTLIKIDVEGFELQVLQGARETILRHRPALVVEMHTHIWPDIKVRPEAMAALLGELPYTVTPIEGQDPLREYGHVLLESRDVPPDRK